MPTAPSPRFPAGVTVIAKGATESTNDDAIALAPTAEAAFTLVWADQQLQGRGRRGRPWASPSGNVYWTMLADASSDPPYSSGIVFVTALAVQATVRAFVPAERMVQIKWPNDILVDGHKVCGVLIEAVSGLRGPMYAVGVGLNVISAPPAGTALYPVSCLRDQGSAAHRNDVLTLLTANFLRYLELWRMGGFDALKEQYLTVAYRLKETISIALGVETVVGLYDDVTPEGIVVVLPDGSRRSIGAGDIIMGRT